MLNLFYDFIPVLLFFVAFKFYGIYTATVVGIVVTALQVIVNGVVKRRLDKQQLVTLVVFSVFGGMTLYFHNPIFVKWKPSVVFWIFGCVFLVTQFVGQKTLIQRMLGSVLEDKSPVPQPVWKRLNLAWAVFFLALGTANIYVAYSYSTDAWVNFKFYGILGMLILFSFIQAAYLARYLSESE